MTPTSRTTTDDENGTVEPFPMTTETTGADAPTVEPLAETLVVARPVGPSRLRRTMAALIATVAFEILYLAGVTLIAFASAGSGAIVPTLQSVAISPFAWVPAAVFLLCALIVALPLNGARRAPAITGLLVAVVVYLGTTLFVLLVAAGTSGLSVFVQELGVYPFFLAAIVAREVMVWTRFGHRRVPRTAVVAAS